MASESIPPGFKRRLLDWVGSGTLTALATTIFIFGTAHQRLGQVEIDVADVDGRTRQLEINAAERDARDEDMRNQLNRIERLLAERLLAEQARSED